MKKLLITILCSCFLFGCTSNKPTTLQEDIDALYEGVDKDSIPAYEVIELNEENFEYFAFIPWCEGIEAVHADALINALPHSVVLIRKTDDSVDLEAMANEIKENANPAKWVCVEAEKSEVAVNDDELLLVMTSKDLADQMIANFMD